MERLNKEGLAYYHSLIRGLNQHDLADVVNTLSDKIDNIKFPEIDTTELAKESTLQEESATIQNKIDGLSTTFDDIYAQQLESIIG